MVEYYKVQMPQKDGKKPMNKLKNNGGAGSSDKTLSVTLIVLVALLIATFVMLFVLHAQSTKTDEPKDDDSIPTISNKDNEDKNENKNTTPLYPTSPSRESYKSKSSAGVITLSDEIKSNKTILVELDGYTSIVEKGADAKIYPASMTKAIADYCQATKQPAPESVGQYVRCIFESLALRYRQVVEMLRELSPVAIERLYVIGGGARNEVLNQFTANAIGIPVETGSSESTAIGNVMMQAKWAGVVDSIGDMRTMIRESLDERKRYEPQEAAVWSAAYEKYLNVYKEL